MFTLTRTLVTVRSRNRCGVIPYTIFKDKLFFLCAIDAKSKDYSDFGGGIKNKETAAEGGIREFEEESLGIFDEEKYKINSFMNTVALDNSKLGMSVIFCPVEEKWKKSAEQLFSKKRKTAFSKKYLEVESVQWLSFETFQECIFSSSSKLWNRLRSFFRIFFINENFYNDFIVLLSSIYLIKYKKNTLISNL